MLRLISLLLLTLALAGCREEGLTTTTTRTGVIPPPEIITATITTVVIDQDGTAINDATISGLRSDGRTNPDGSLTIDAGSLSTDGTLITVASPGHWPERRLLMPAGDGQLLETFVLEPRVKAGEINTSAGGAIVLAPNYSITLPANTIVTRENGSTYTGQMDVYLNHDAPEDRAEMRNSPGNALARLESGVLVSMESYGMLDVALESPTGEPLELAPTTPAEIRLPLLPTTTPEAPAEIDFWKLEVTEGYWEAAGTATLGPDYYTAFVRGGGTYNLDVPHPLAQLHGRLTDTDGRPLTHQAFSLDVAGGRSCWNATVDSDGEFRAWVAAGTDLRFVTTDKCTGTSAVLPVAAVPEGTAFSAGDLVVDFNLTAFATEVSACPGGGSDPGQVEIWVNGFGNAGKYTAQGPGGFANVSVENCDGEEILLQAFSRDYRRSSPLLRRTPEDGSTARLTVCGDLEPEEFFTLTIDGAEVPISELAPIYWPGNGNFNWLVRATGSYEGEEYSMLLNFSSPAVGDFAAGDAAAVVYRLRAGQNFGEGRVYVAPAEAFTLRGTALTATEDLFQGSFSASMNLQNDEEQILEAVNLPVTGTFRLKL